MATLGSPGVQVSVIDESFYTPAAPGTVPLIFVATAANKQNAAGTGTAQGTLTSKAGDVWVITSQRDLTDTFGTPLFYTDTSGNAVHASELNEYGLQAAYSALGVSSRAYIVRADIDLGQLAPTATAPVGAPNGGQYWVDTASTLFGVNEWDATTLKFTAKTVKVVDDSSTEKEVDSTDLNGASVYKPTASFGSQGDYAMVVTASNTNKLWYKKADNTWTAVSDGFDGGKSLVIAPHTSYPSWTDSNLTGSIWIKTTNVAQGANWSIKVYSSATKAWSATSANMYSSARQALEKLDYTGGGKNIPVGTLFIESNYDHGASASDYKANFKIWRRNATGATSISTVSTAVLGSESNFSIKETLANSSAWGDNTLVTIPGVGTGAMIARIPAAISAAGLTNVSATYDSATNKLTITHALGGDIQMTDGTGTPLALAGFVAGTTANLYHAPALDEDNLVASNWKPLSYQAKSSAPYENPADGTLWYDSAYDADILVHNGTTWVGYRTQYSGTDPAGPIVRATEPVDGDRSDSGNLVTNDIWISTASADNYGKDIYVYDSTLAAGKRWVKQDVTDHFSPNGWVFADARWGTTGSATTPATIKDLLLSSYLDADAPDPALYPRGTRLWNTRRSGNNVKKYVSNHVDLTATNPRQSNAAMTSYAAARWVSQQSANADGSGRFGRYAQRGVVVAAMKSLIDTNLAVRDTDTLVFNLIAAPGYTEALANMVALNTNRGQTAFVVGDTPFRLAPNATALTAWGNNSNSATDNGEVGAVTYDEYASLFYPSGFTTDNSGNNIVVPASHMMLRTIINSDAKSYQWFAPAGTRRGNVDNATSVGYVDTTGAFKPVALYEGLRNTLHDVKINPIATLPGVGIVNFGQYTRAPNASALDRINVARLIGYLRRQLSILAKPFLFEPNDAQTRREIKAAADSLLLELVGQRALYDFVTVCDSTNNTPARIDKSELWLDIAVEPVKAVEFIYIPLRIKNTGEIAAGV